MKSKLLSTIFSAILIGSSFSASAHDFEVSMNSGNVYYVNVLDTLLRTAEITYAGEYSRPDCIKATGVVSIPEKVSYKGQDYRIVKIGVKAFCAGEKIESVILPSSVKQISEFAFEGCTSLKSIVFPGSQVKIGEGAFWNCSNIEEIAFGSDWTEVDFDHFKWSTALKDIEIPVKVRKILHLRAIKSLENINIDEKNNAFASVDGVLYSGNKSVLYTCPVAHKADVIVPEGTKSILRGAFLECGLVEAVSLPSTIEELSFVDFVALVSLKSLTLNIPNPIMTAKFDGEKVFALKLAPSAKLYVPKASVKMYVETVCSVVGKYESLDGKDTIECSEADLLNAKNITRIK